MLPNCPPTLSPYNDASVVYVDSIFKRPFLPPILKPAHNNSVALTTAQKTWKALQGLSKKPAVTPKKTPQQQTQVEMQKHQNKLQKMKRLHQITVGIWKKQHNNDAGKSKVVELPTVKKGRSRAKKQRAVQHAALTKKPASASIEPDFHFHIKLLDSFADMIGIELKDNVVRIEEKTEIALRQALEEFTGESCPPQHLVLQKSLGCFTAINDALVKSWGNGTKFELDISQQIYWKLIPVK